MSGPLTEQDREHLQAAHDHTCTNPDCPCPAVAQTLTDLARQRGGNDDASLAKLLLRLSAVLSAAADTHDLTGQAAAWCLLVTAAHLAGPALQEAPRA